MHPLPNLLRHPQGIAAVTAGSAAILGVAAYLMLRRRITPEQLEERRRNRLSTQGRIIDGTLIDTALQDSPDESPHALIYRYRIGGVTYERGQDISTLLALLPDLGPTSTLFGTPIQVRYDRDNPADSIVISETWNGLWNQNQHHVEQEPRKPA